jgi:hypothetical protein
VDCLQETTCVEVLSKIYPEVKIIVCQNGVILPPVEILFSSQWLPQKTHGIWNEQTKELIFLLVKTTQERDSDPKEQDQACLARTTIHQDNEQRQLLLVAWLSGS